MPGDIYYIVNYPQELTYQFCIFKGWYEYFPEIQQFRCYVEDYSLSSGRWDSRIRSFDVVDMPKEITQLQYDQLRELINKIKKQVNEYDELAKSFYFGKGGK